ncbi:MAG TPA: phosphatidic acid phosphatase [Verrucomicrobiales bacterium]|nr:phosphatidic acid phosphatase [Verrucomicrobiales bacterium]
MRSVLAWHELLFLVLGTGVLTALALTKGLPGLTISIACGLAAYAVLLGRTQGGDWLRLLGSYGVAWAFYAGASRVVEALGVPLRHQELLAADAALFGQSPALAWQGRLSAWENDGLSAAYLSYHLYLHWALLDALWRDTSWRRQISAYLFAAFGLGFVGYLLYPAAPPYVAFPELFPEPVKGGLLTVWNQQINTTMAARYDAFPSLHVLITLTLLSWDWAHFRTRFWAMLVPSVLMLVATLALRLHYAVDLLASLLLFLILLLCHARPATRRSLGP